MRPQKRERNASRQGEGAFTCESAAGFSRGWLPAASLSAFRAAAVTVVSLLAAAAIAVVTGTAIAVVTGTAAAAAAGVVTADGEQQRSQPGHGQLTQATPSNSVRFVALIRIAAQVRSSP